MRIRHLWLLPFLLLSLTLIGSGRPLTRLAFDQLSQCKDFAFSTEEDFVTQGPEPADGNPVISDGDLLGLNHAVCLRNRDLLKVWQIDVDLGLDAVDILDVERGLIAFSTELNDPGKRFTAGDLLTTMGAVIPNQVLLTRFQVQGDRGLDAVHFAGVDADIVAFLDLARTLSREDWLKDPGKLATELERYKVDIWFSIEGTELRASTFSILDGDLLSAATGTIVASNAQLLPAGVPAGLPDRGVDFGLDGFSAGRTPKLQDGRFSTEILYRGKPAFTDGDILAQGNGIYITDVGLYKPFEPKANFLGTDALYINVSAAGQAGNYLPLIVKQEQEVSQ